MLNYKTDPLLFDKAKNPKNYLTVKDIKSKLIFLNKNILNLYSAFIKKNDFKKYKNKKYYILRRLPYLKGKESTKLFLKLVNQKYNKNNNYIKIREEIANYCQIKNRINLKNFKEWIDKNNIPLIAARIIASKFKKEFKVLAGLIKHAEKIICINTPGFYPPITIEGCLTNKNIYFIGAAYGDGGFCSENIWHFCDGGKKEDLIHAKQYVKNIANLIKSVYKIDNIKIKKLDNQFVIDLPNKFFTRYLNFFFDLPFNKKDDKLNLPGLITKYKQEKTNIFYRGLCDTDGSYRKFSNNFTLGMRQNILLINFTKLLDKNKIQHTIRKIISHTLHINVSIENLNKFAEIIGSSHPRKQNILFNHLKKGPTHNSFKGIKKENIISNLFNITKLKKLRVYSNNLLDNITINDIIIKTKIHRQTAHNWKKGKSAVPLETLQKLLKNSKLQLLQLLSKKKYKFTIGTTGSNKAHLPIKISKDIIKYGSCVRSNKRGLYLNIRKNPDALNYKRKIEDLFKIKFKYTKSKEFQCNSQIADAFFRTFFIYGKSWHSYNNDKIEKLKANCNKIYE